MVEVRVWCDYCKEECTNDNVDLIATRHQVGMKPQHSNKSIQLCFSCFNSLFNKNMDIEFLTEDEIEGYDDFYK